MIGREEQSPNPGSTADTDPNKSLNRLEILRGMRASIWEGSFATVHGSLTAGAFLTGFALWLGANDLALGLLTAIPTAAGLVQVVASYFGQRAGPRKRFVAWFALIGRTLWIPIAIAPFFFPRSFALPLFLTLFALSFALLNVTVPAWTSWMSDLVPADHRGRYFAHRNVVAGIVGMIIGLPAAWFLDFSTRVHHWAGVGFAVLFGAAALGGVASFFTLLRQPEPPARAPAHDSQPGARGILDFYRAPFLDRNFRSLVLFNMLFGTGQFFAAPFFTVYALQSLHLNYLWLQVFATVSSLAGLGSMSLWGYLTDKFGNKPLLAIGVVGVFFLPIIWILTTAERPHMALALLTLNNLMGGLFWAGVGLAQFNLLIRLSPPGKTSIYVATMAALTGLAGGLAPLLGGVMMNALAGWHAHIPGMEVTNFHATFAVAAALRMLALPLLGPVIDASSTPTRDVLQQLSGANPRAWRDISRLRTAHDEETRLRATAALASSRTRLAASELVLALSDPSLAVREEAAHALGEIGDPQVLPALIAAVRDPASGLAGEAARALGRIGDREAAPALIELLEDDTATYSREDRIHAIRALGQLGGADAAAALIAAIAEPERTDEETEVVARALGQIGDLRAAPVLSSRLRAGDATRPLRLAIVRALGELPHASALPALREELRFAAEDGVLFPLLADALARQGDTGAVPALVQGLARQGSAVARRQAARAVGELMGVGDQVYALLSQEDFNRDSAVARLAEEVRKRTGAAQIEEAITEALEAYVAESYSRSILALGRAALPLVPFGASSSSTATHCAVALREMATLPADAVSLEIALLAWCAVRGMMS